VPSIDRGPLPRNTLSGVRLRTSRAPRLSHRVARSRRLCTPASPFGNLARAGPPSTWSRCQRGSRFSRPRSSLADFCNRYDARAHPSSCQSSHASGAFAPLLAGTNRCRLRWPLRCVATPGACEPRLAHAGFHSDAFRLRGRGESRAEAFEQRPGSRALVTMSRVPFS